MNHRTLFFVIVASIVSALTVVSARAQTTAYDFSSVYVAPTSSNGPTTTPLTIGIATFTSPSDPGAFSVGQNNGLYGFSGAYYLGDGGFPATLAITFQIPQTSISFDYANGDFFELNGGDTLTLTAGSNTPVTSTDVTFDPTASFYPYGSISYTSATPFTTITISNSDAAGPEDLAISNLTTTAPEPATWALMLGGLGTLAFFRRRHSRAS